MYQDYDKAVEKVMEYLERNHYTSSIVRTYQRCFRLIKEFFKKNHDYYSHELAMEWLASVTPGLCKSTFKTYRLALSRINAAYKNQEIVNTKAVYQSQQNYQNLDPWCRHLLDEFLEKMSSSYVVSFLQTLKIAGARFLTYTTRHGVSRPEDISHHIVANYYYDDRHDSYKSKDVYNGCIRMFLRYLVALGIIRSSIPLMLDKFTLARMVFIEELPKTEQENFHQDYSQILFSAEEFYTRLGEVSFLVVQQKYSLTMRRTFHNAWKELFIFLEANELGYSKEIALTWASYMKNYTLQWKTFRRAMKLFEQYLKTGSLQPKTVYTYQSDPADDLPKWCKTDYDLFMLHKKKEGVAVSTLSMYRSSCLRFLFYLERTGIASWDIVTPEVIKEFHYTDPHNTPEGKNAYAAKIRAFLDYLSEAEQVPFTLQLALSNECAPQVTIIKTLDDDELSVIYQYKEVSHKVMQLRNTAMVLLGLRMGFRASDITKLKLSDISWLQQTISVQQQKTDRFLKLPMPTEVGNSLYRYITMGRPETSCEYVFVAHRVPYDRLHRGVCLKALNHVLNKNSHGFHITRRTFASRMLQKDTNPEMIAEALGHSDDTTVMKYLSTNGEKMRQCAIPLAEITVKGGLLT
ncbi:integrase family protein [Clostridium aceticum]|uniref:Integrase family protein n=1 Tax=Clostridium aceticum TaxID=84022 RepID=A0A0D8IEC0_9CLOT|nr:tyrosine-type recombinase/integrase [Clostridium aceticum]AKL94351.1 integrase family protein [Clostridium aceticum]KJF28414.1 hypothetical protein TZ02_03375 [Clostridium aceticum]